MWTFAWMFVLEAVAITAANAATIVIFTRTRRLHSKQYIMIISQAVADLFVGLVSVPMFIVAKLINKETSYLSSLLRLFLITDGFFAAASLFGLAALAIERAHATYFQFRHSTLGKGPYIVGIVLMWAGPMIVVGPYILSIDKNTSINIKTSIFWVTLVVISGAYSLIVLKVRCTITQSHDVIIQENKKLTVTLAVVTVLSLVTWLPFQFLGLLTGFNAPSTFLYYLVKFLQYCNSLVNSIVYAFRMREIKTEFLRVFQYCRNNQIGADNES